MEVLTVRQRALPTALLLLMWLGAPAVCLAASPQSSADEVKAAFLLNFARFSEWPADSAGGPLVVCVLNNRHLFEAVSATVGGQTINGRRLEALQPSSAAEAGRCHLLYLDAGAERDGRAVPAGPILTVSDVPNFATRGEGIVELTVENGKMRFAINATLANRSGIKLSSRLLSLARVVSQ